MDLLDLIPLVGKIFDRVLPDKAAADAAKLKVMELAQAGDLAELDANLKLAVGQIDVNKIEAASTDRFVAGWRPFVGWVCGAGLAMSCIIAPLFTWVATLAGHPVSFPPFNDPLLRSTLAGMLGLGFGLRTYEKKLGVAS